MSMILSSDPRVKQTNCDFHKRGFWGGESSDSSPNIFEEAWKREFNN